MTSLRVVVVLLGSSLALTGAGPAPSAYTSAGNTAHSGRQAPAVPQTKDRFPVVRMSSFAGIPPQSTKTPRFVGQSPTRQAPPPTTPQLPARPLAFVNGPVVYNNLNKQGIAAGPSAPVPPDSTGAIGPNNFIEMTNNGIAVYDRSLNLQTFTDLDTFAGAPATPLCDVQIEWDPSANRWLYSVLICNTGSSSQAVGIGWSKTSNPADGWCNGNGINLSPLLFDFQKLGHNTNFLIIGGNLYNETIPSSNPPFVSAGVLWLPLPANGDTSCTFPTAASGNTLPLRNGDGTTLSFTPVPVNTDNGSGDGYIVAAYDVANNFGEGFMSGRKLTVWHIDTAGVLRRDGDVGVNVYNPPSPAQEKGSGNLIDTLDGRLTQAEGNPETGIYIQHTVGGASGSEVDWYELTVSNGFVSLAQQGAITWSNTWVFNAAISPRFDGQGAAIFYNISNSTIDPQIYAQSRRPSTPAGTFESGTLLLVSSPAADTETLSCNVGGFPCRWGDYAGATPDPVNPYVVWGTGEYNTASTNSISQAWSDQNFAVVVADRPLAPTNVTAVDDGRGDVSVTWTASADDGGSPIIGYQVNLYLGTTFQRSLTVSGAANGMRFTGVPHGPTFSFKVQTKTVWGVSLESANSNTVVSSGAIKQSSGTLPGPPRPPVAPSNLNPPTHR